MANEQLQQASQAMEQATESLGQSDQPAALGQQEAALEALQQATEAFEAALAEMGQPEQGQMATEQGQTPAPTPAQQPGQPHDQAMESQQRTESEDTERAIGEKKDPAGEKAARKDAKWSAMGKREREMLYQSYARELPIEYRDLLEDYYEALAK